MPAVRLVTTTGLTIPDPDMPLLVAGFGARGIDVVVDSWRDATVDWSDADITIVRSPWDYTEHLGDFLAWAKHVAERSQLWNPEPLLRWNIHKSYLLDLAARGAPIVPTVVLTQGSGAALDAIADAQGWNGLVLKPAVGSGARGAGRFEVGDESGQIHLDALLRAGDALVQPYISSVESEGEWSLLLFDGRLSHAVRKRPAAGDYRVQEHHGGRNRSDNPSAALQALAERVATVLPTPALYARIDLLALNNQWHVLEVEVTEPALFLTEGGPAATERLVDATIARLG